MILDDIRVPACWYLLFHLFLIWNLHVHLEVNLVKGSHGHGNEAPFRLKAFLLRIAKYCEYEQEWRSNMFQHVPTCSNDSQHVICQEWWKSPSHKQKNSKSISQRPFETAVRIASCCSAAMSDHSPQTFHRQHKPANGWSQQHIDIDRDLHLAVASAYLVCTLSLSV